MGEGRSEMTLNRDESVTLEYVREKLRPINEFDFKCILNELGEYIHRNGMCNDDHPTRYTVSALVQKAQDMDEARKLLSRF